MSAHTSQVRAGFDYMYNNNRNRNKKGRFVKGHKLGFQFHQEKNYGFQKGHISFPENGVNKGWIKKGQKLRQGKTGYKETEEHKKNISDALKGKMPKNLAQINVDKKGSGNPFYGKHHTDKWKEEHSKKLCGKMPKNIMRAGQYGNIKRGWYKINGKKYFFRSNWEVTVARYLEFLIGQKKIKSWSYEKKVFIFEKIKFGTRSYRPDFEVIKNDNSTEYWEVKGYIDDKSKTKIKRMAKYYPEVTLIVIGKDEYKPIKDIERMFPEAKKFEKETK